MTFDGSVDRPNEMSGRLTSDEPGCYTRLSWFATTGGGCLGSAKYLAAQAALADAQAALASQQAKIKKAEKKLKNAKKKGNETKIARAKRKLRRLRAPLHELRNDLFYAEDAAKFACV